MIEVRDLVKKYGETTAVDHLSFTVEPGRITGFLGPNGAGKSTTMRLILGLDRPSAGSALIDGKPYRDLRDPLRHVGALLEARAVHGGRSAFNHLLYLAQTQGVPKRRVQEVLDLVGLGAVANKRPKGFSLGMGQRLGIACALLADPRILILDEPVNGLDPEGVRWVRELLRGLAAEGRTVMLSSHLMSEMAQTADRLVIVGRGRLLADTTVDALVEQSAGNTVRVASSETERLRSLLMGPGVAVTPTGAERLVVAGLDTRQIGQLAAKHQVPLYELAIESVSLEDAFMKLTHDAVEYHSSDAGRAA